MSGEGESGGFAPSVLRLGGSAAPPGLAGAIGVEGRARKGAGDATHALCRAPALARSVPAPRAGQSPAGRCSSREREAGGEAAAGAMAPGQPVWLSPPSVAWETSPCSRPSSAWVASPGAGIAVSRRRDAEEQGPS